MMSREETIPTIRARSSEDKKIRCNLESTKRRANLCKEASSEALTFKRFLFLAILSMTLLQNHYKEETISIPARVPKQRYNALYNFI